MVLSKTTWQDGFGWRNKIEGREKQVTHKLEKMGKGDCYKTKVELCVGFVKPQSMKISKQRQGGGFCDLFQTPSPDLMRWWGFKGHSGSGGEGAIVLSFRKGGLGVPKKIWNSDKVSMDPKKPTKGWIRAQNALQNNPVGVALERWRVRSAKNRSRGVSDAQVEVLAKKSKLKKSRERRRGTRERIIGVKYGGGGQKRYPRPNSTFWNRRRKPRKRTTKGSFPSPGRKSAQTAKDL